MSEILAAVLVSLAGATVGILAFYLYCIAVARWLTKDPDA